eukprot:Tbor_TRINITY_DN3028_c0_g1::TRINITY_DN3028_c0_g1_i1::g.17428::m.17428/K12176/COPS2, CSN2, TRIP15; COP9 signalosome complex subunit 2
MSDDEYFFDYGDEGDNAEDNDDCRDKDDEGQVPDVEAECDTLYAANKHIMDSQPKESEEGLRKVIEMDLGTKGKMSWKAMKMLSRLMQRQKRYDPDMYAAYTDMITFHFSGRTLAMLEKCITKFIDRCERGNVPPVSMGRIYEITLATNPGDQIYFMCKNNLAKLSVDTGDLASAKHKYRELLEWARSGEDAEIRRGFFLIKVYAALIEIETAAKNYDAMADLYHNASQVSVTLAPVTGVIKECGGKLLMRQSDFKNAHSLFLDAFTQFNEAGDSRRVNCLKYLVVSSMLAKSSINPFDTPETKALEHDPEIRPISKLIEAAEKNDIQVFSYLLKDSVSRSVIFKDPFLIPFLQPLITHTREKKLIAICRPYNRVRISFLAEAMQVTEEEVLRLCTCALLEGTLQGVIDDTEGVLLLTGSGSKGMGRYQMLEAWGKEYDEKVRILCSRLPDIIRSARTY